jgi:DNA replication licensing factor MCM2
MGNSDDEVEGDDLMDDMEKDYEERPELDRYEMDGLDDDDQNELSMGERMQVDKRLDQEERMRQLGRRPGALMDEEYDEDDEMLHN